MLTSIDGPCFHEAVFLRFVYTSCSALVGKFLCLVWWPNFAVTNLCAYNIVTF